MPDEDEKDKDKKTKDDIKKKARGELSDKRSYADDPTKLSSKGKRPDVDEYYDAYLEWVEKIIEDEKQQAKILVRMLRFRNGKPNKEQILDMITSEKQRILEDPTIIKRKSTPTRLTEL